MLEKSGRSHRWHATVANIVNYSLKQRTKAENQKKMVKITTMIKINLNLTVNQ